MCSNCLRNIYPAMSSIASGQTSEKKLITKKYFAYFSVFDIACLMQFQQLYQSATLNIFSVIVVGFATCKTIFWYCIFICFLFYQVHMYCHNRVADFFLKFHFHREWDINRPRFSKNISLCTPILKKKTQLHLKSLHLMIRHYLKGEGYIAYNSSRNK